MTAKAFCRYCVLTIIMGIFVYLGFRLIRGADRDIPALFLPITGPKTLISMDGFTFARSEEGGVTWKMNASNADLYENREARMKNITILFASHEKKNVNITGEEGTIDISTGNANLRSVAGDVRVVTGDGYLLTTNSLTWSADERMMRTKDPFKVLGKEIYLEGRGLTADVEMRKLRVSADVKAVLQE